MQENEKTQQTHADNSKKSGKVVRAIDLGFGFTKILQDVTAAGRYKPAMFPSIVTRSSSKDLGAGIYSERNTIEVEHNKIIYEVGEEVMDAVNGIATRVLDNNYIESDQYQILMKGALKSMNVPRIDLLVLGAPVKKYNEAAAYLKEKWTGDIKLDSTTKVKVCKVHVLPQPLGGLAWHSNEMQKYKEYRKQMNLTLDPGHYTFDWLVANGMKMTTRSGSHEGGMSFVLKALAKSMNVDTSNLNVMMNLDKSLYSNTEFRVNGKPKQIADHMTVVDAVIRESISAMQSSIGSSSDIDNILLIGGGAELYYPHVIKAFPNHHVMVTKGKSFANVFGFQHLGEQLGK